MNYREIKPGQRLKDYVKCYYVYESDSDMDFEDVVFPSGCTEIIFNLGDGKWQTGSNAGFVTNPPVELWGQIIRPLPVKSIGKNIMLGIRFFPHGAALLLNDNIDMFNNQVFDFRDIAGNAVHTLYLKLLENSGWHKRIRLLEDFLFHCFSLSERKVEKVAFLNRIMKELGQDDFYENFESVASRNGVTSRYLQKLFLQYTGLTPKLYIKINRFQNSLRLINRNEFSLTSVAYDCGYFDQSHFIREFKSFTGFTPSAYSSQSSPITVAFANN